MKDLKAENPIHLSELLGNFPMFSGHFIIEKQGSICFQGEWIDEEKDLAQKTKTVKLGFVPYSKDTTQADLDHDFLTEMAKENTSALICINDTGKKHGDITLVSVNVVFYDGKELDTKQFFLELENDH